MSASARVRLVAGVLAILLAIVLPSGVGANHSWGPYHWRNVTGEVALNVGDNVSAAWDAFLAEAIDDWNPSSVINLTVVAGGTSARNCKPISGRIEVCSSSYGNTGWLGVAQIWVSDGQHITQATTKVNDTYFNTAFYNTPAWRRLVMCQEIAHDFGLDHQDEAFDNANLGSCMDYTNDPDGTVFDQLSNEHPNQHDFDQLETIYAHTDSPAGGGGGGGGGGRGRGGAGLGILDIFPTPAQARLQFDEPYQWGRLVRSNGRVALYDVDFGNGRHVYTFVIWA